MLEQTGWAAQGVESADIFTKKGVALREFPLNPGPFRQSILKKAFSGRLVPQLNTDEFSAN